MCTEPGVRRRERRARKAAPRAPAHAARARRSARAQPLLAACALAASLLICASAAACATGAGVSIATATGRRAPRAASARSRLACRSGTTAYRRGAVRVFYVRRHLRSQPSLAWRDYYACRAGAQRPRLVYEGEPATFAHVYGFRVIGARLGFLATSEGYAGGGEAIVGWLDLRSGELRSGAIEIDEQQYTPASAPRVPLGRVRYAIADDGAVAVLGEEGTEQEIVLLEVGAKALRAPKRLYYALAGAVEPGSLAIDASAVSWRTRSGVEESASR